EGLDLALVLVLALGEAAFLFAEVVTLGLEFAFELLPLGDHALLGFDLGAFAGGLHVGFGALDDAGSLGPGAGEGLPDEQAEDEDAQTGADEQRDSRGDPA